MVSKKELFFVAFVLVCTIVFFGISDTDLFIQDKFYNFQEQKWLLDREDALLKFIFYDGIKKLLIAIALVLLLALLFFKKHTLIQEYKHGLIIVLLCAFVIPTLIGGLKKITNMPCPKQECRYGGSIVRTALWQDAQQERGSLACWPAGHASGGFALMSLFFLFKSKKNRYLALAMALLIGWLMGLYKMFIGDHFFSHTLITMLLAWFCILSVIYFMQYFNTKTSKENS